MNKLDKLALIQRTIDDYCRWLAPEFPEVLLVLENLQAVADGTQSLCASHPPSERGPWSTPSLREVLRSRKPVPLLRSDTNPLRDAISWLRGIKPVGNQPNHEATLEYLESMLARLTAAPRNAGQLPPGRPHP